MEDVCGNGGDSVGLDENAQENSQLKKEGKEKETVGKGNRTWKTRNSIKNISQREKEEYKEIQQKESLQEEGISSGVRKELAKGT